MCLIWFERSGKVTISKSKYFLLFVLLIWTCLHFSYNPIPSIRYDLRIIPIVIGGLYLGIGPQLAIVVIILRSLYGVESGFYLTLLLYGPLGIVLWRLHFWFRKQRSKRRILIAVCSGIILGVITVGDMLINKPPHYWIDSCIAYLIIPPLGIGIISYSIEFVRRNNEMKVHLIKAEKLQAVEQMGAAISHEIRNPLTAAIGFVQLLQDGYIPRVKQIEYLSIVKDELQAAERVIQDYLTFAKPSLMTFEELNIKKELKQVINMLQPLANQNSVQITTDFAIIGFIQGDRQKFHQCFINVIKNAIESMPAGGYLSIVTEYNKTHITIKVKDTGVGMTKEQLELLGEPYYSTKGAKGTGLGMMVVYSIVRAMDGVVSVDSKVELGTTFQFKFPVYRDSFKNVGF
jgi:two-component system, sporulation sensor kinase B